MPLQGQLGHIGLADVLQTALAGSRGGELTVTRGPERAVLHLTGEGLFLLEPEVLDAEDVLHAFADRGHLPAEATQALESSRSNAQSVLDGLIASNQLSEAEVLELVAGVVEDTVLTLLTWREGAFRFQEGQPSTARKGLVARVGVDLEGVLLRAAHRLDERRVLEQTVGSNAVLFRALDAPPPPSDPSERLDEVHAALDGRTTVGEIALRLGLSRFALLKSVAALVEAGAARAADPGELEQALAERLEHKRLRVAREIAMQWATDHPEDPGGPRALVRVAEARERPAEVAAAFTLLGERLFARGEHEAALGAYQDALSRRPGEVSALQGLRAAADAAGDASLWASTTLRLGQSLLDEDDPAGARALAAEVRVRVPGDVGALLLEARGCVGLKDREALVAAAQALVDQLDGKAQKRAEREAADFCRDAIALLAPERSDLLRGLRRLTENPRGKRRRLALVGALLAVASTAGVLLWPTSAGSLLAQARTAMEAGDTADALALAERIIADFPDTEEAAQAFDLQAQLVPAASKSSAGPSSAQKKQDLKAQLPALAAALAGLPQAAATTALAELKPTFAAPQKGATLPAPVLALFEETLKRLAQDARGRRDALALARSPKDRARQDAAALRQLLELAQSARDPAHGAALAAAARALEPFVEAANHEPTRRLLRELASEVALLSKAIATHDGAVQELRRRLAQLDLEAIHASCREQGARLLVAGRLGDADALYKQLEARLAEIARDPALEPLRDMVDRMHLGDFVRERRALVAEVMNGLEAARSAATAGDLQAAANTYHALAQRHYTIRFEELVRVPLDVTSVPAGAEVSLNGKVLGTTPLRMEYPWGGPTTLSLSAPGFEPHVTLLDTTKDKPVVSLLARLAPSTRWRVALGGNVEARPLDVDGNLVVCDRAGRLTMLAGTDGRILWSRHLKSLEGARGRPTAVPGAVLAAFLDGRVACLDVRDGEVLAEHQIARPVGDLASVGDMAAIAVGTPALVGMRLGGASWTTPLPAHVTAGVLAAHGAFWVGLADGGVLRVDPRSGAATRLELTGLSGSVVGLAADAEGVLLATASGQVATLGAQGALRWTAANLGDLAGAPTAAAGRIVAADRKGTMTFLDAQTGSPVHAVTAGREAVGGLLAHGDCVAGMLADGRLWVYDARTLTAVAEAPISSKGLAPAATLGGDHLGVVTKDGQVLALPFVGAPRPAGSNR